MDSLDSFGEAFAAARREGRKTFVWHNMNFTTELAETGHWAKPAPKPKTTIDLLIDRVAYLEKEFRRLKWIIEGNLHDGQLQRVIEDAESDAKDQ